MATINFICGAECQITSAQMSGLVNGVGHFFAAQGDPTKITVDTTVFDANGGVASWKFDTSVAANNAYMNFTQPVAGKKQTLSAKIRIGAAPGVLSTLIQANNASGSLSVLLTTGRQLQVQAGASVAVNFGTVLTVNTWYKIDVAFDVSTGTASITAMLDGANQGQSTAALASANFSEVRVGSATATSQVQFWADQLTGTDDTANYPSEVIFVKAFGVGVTSGTHNQTAGDFKDSAAANITNGDSSGGLIDEIPLSTADYVAQTVLRTTSYYEAIYNTSTATKAPLAVTQIVNTVMASAASGTQKAQLYDGTTAADTYATTAASVTTVKNGTKGWAVTPSGGAWTLAVFQTLRLRWGFSGDVTPNPRLVNTILEAAFPLIVTTRGFGQAQVDIKAVGYGFGQAQADIKAIGRGFGQAQTDIKAVGQGFGQAQADIKSVGFGFGQTQADIKAVSFGYGQSQADIKAISRGFGQSQADIKAIGRGFGQSQASIKATSNGFGQAQTDIKAVGRGFGQSQADIKAVNYGFGQAQADVKAVSYGFGQAQTLIAVNSFKRFGQASALISGTFFTPFLDTFTRTVSNGLGTSDNGDTWTLVGSSTASNFSVDGSKALIVVGATDQRIDLPQTLITDRGIEISAKISIDKIPDTSGTILYLGSNEPSITGTGIVPILYLEAVKTTNNIQLGTANRVIIVGYTAGDVWLVKVHLLPASGNQILTRVSATLVGNPENGLGPDGFIPKPFPAPGHVSINVTGATNGNDPITWSIDDFQIIPAWITRSGQAQASIKATSFGFGQAQTTILATSNGYGQAQASIKAVEFGFGQANADILASSQGYGQAQADIKATTNQFGQAQARILTTYNGFGQAQTSVLAVGYGFGQAQCTVRGNAFGQAQADIKQTYQGYGQANADVKAVGYGFGQAQSDILAKGFGFGQAQSDIKAVGQGFGQAQSDIKAVGYGFAQSQADIKSTTNKFGQAQAQIKQTYRGFAQAQADIKAVSRGYGQAQADILQTYPTPVVATYAQDTFTRVVVDGFGSADIGGAYTLSGTTADFDVDGSVGTHTHPAANAVHAARLAINKLDQDITVQVAMDKTPNASASYLSAVELRFVNGANFYRAIMHATSTGDIQASIQVTEASVTTALVGPTQITRESYVAGAIYNIRAQAQGANPTILRVKIWRVATTEPVLWDFAVTDSAAAMQVSGGIGLRSQTTSNTTNVPVIFSWDNLNVTSIQLGGFGQAQARILATTNQFAQAQADIKAISYGFGQAQADIKATSNGFGQAQADIRQTYQGYSQAQAYIFVYVPYGFGQAQAYIAGQGFGFGQAQADIKQTYQGYAQAQVSIKTTYNAFGQAQADIKATSNIFGQAQADIKVTTFAYAQAQADIKAIGYGFAQAQSDIKSTSSVFGQAQADILTTYNAFGQAQADIKSTSQAYGQAQALIGIRQVAFGQSQATIKATSTQSGQAQADIQTTYKASGQAQARIRATYYGFGQAQGHIVITGYGFGQAQCTIRGNAFGQAQTWVKTTVTQSGNAQAAIKVTVTNTGQAQALVVSKTFAFGQAQADILHTYDQFAQAQAQIKVTIYAFGQAQTFIRKSAGYGQAQAYIIQTHELLSLDLSDRPSLNLQLVDIDRVSIDNDDVSINLTLVDRSMGLVLTDHEELEVVSDTSVIGLTLTDHERVEITNTTSTFGLVLSDHENFEILDHSGTIGLILTDQNQSLRLSDRDYVG